MLFSVQCFDTTSFIELKTLQHLTIKTISSTEEKHKILKKIFQKNLCVYDRVSACCWNVNILLPVQSGFHRKYCLFNNIIKNFNDNLVNNKNCTFKSMKQLFALSLIYCYFKSFN